MTPIKHDKLDSQLLAEVLAGAVHVTQIEDLSGKVPHVGFGGATKSSYVAPKSGRTIYVLERSGQYAPDAFGNDVWHFESDFSAAEAADFLTAYDLSLKTKTSLSDGAVKRHPSELLESDATRIGGRECAGTVPDTLREFLGERAAEVKGWVTDQAVVLTDGSMKVTSYFSYGQAGAVLREALEPTHPESYDGLWARFDAGERFVPGPGAASEDSLSGALSQDGQVSKQFQDLIFTMHDAWGHVHANGDEQLKRQWLTLMRSYGDCAEEPAEPSIEGNRQLFAALVNGKACVAVPFTSESLRTKYARVLEQHAELETPVALDPRICRLAFVNEWSDGLVARAREHLRGAPDEVLGAMQRAADDLNLSVLRGGDETLAQRAAATLGFASADDLRHFQRENPPLSVALKAEPALEGGFGRVVGVSSTEVVFATEHGPMFFERAWLKAQVGVGDEIRVGKFGEAEVTAGASAAVYEPGKKYNGPIPEIKYLPVTAIHRQEMDFRPEVMTVSDEVADNMDFSEPVEVTAFRYGPANHDTLPEVTLRDGHHRTAAAIQTGRPHLPVQVKAVNAMGEKLNALIAMSQVIEASLEAEALLAARL